MFRALVQPQISGIDEPKSFWKVTIKLCLKNIKLASLVLKNLPALAVRARYLRNNWYYYWIY